MASSSPSSTRKNFKYHVFISFRGEDTRTSFVDHLYASLKRSGIHTFRDNEELQKGKRIDELFKSIEESKFFIIVFSKNYASSSWCLKELAKIMECQDEIERIAYPLFHDVEPTHIRKQSGPVGRGPVGRAIAKHKSDKHIKTWKEALEDAGNLVGWDLKKIANGHEAEAIDQIVKEISIKLRSIHLSKDKNLVGMESRMRDLDLSLGKGLEDEVCMIGIKGMGGIGKTTLARAIYHEISSQFEAKSFVENVRDASKTRGGLLSLQQQVLRDVFNIDNVNSVSDAISTMEMKMPLKKVLLVLDDVNHKDQLEALVGGWFKDGSIIIITTRDEQVLKGHRVKRIHDLNLLSDEESISLFSRYAFERYIPIQGYEDLSFKVVQYAAGLPLTLKVLGSFLLGKEKVAWIDTLIRLETIPVKETLDILEISYDGLEDDHKEIFLDVACFMKGMSKEEAISILESHGFRAIIGLKVLEERSLITIDAYESLNMHDSIEELGKNIVRRSDPDEPNKHSRLWVREEIEALFSDDSVTEATATCIRLAWPELSPEIIMKGLGKLKNLRVLHINWSSPDCLRNNWMFDTDSFPNALRFLRWGYYPGRSLPETFRANNLVELELPDSTILQLWESEEQKVLSNLRFLNLSGSKLRTLDLGMIPNVERLDLYRCADLTRLDVRAGCLKRLVYLNLIDCSSFKSSSFIQQLELLKLLSLPKLLVECFAKHWYELRKPRISCFYGEEQVSSQENSVSLSLQPGTKLESVFGSFCGLQHLRHLTFDGSIKELPNDLDLLANLEELKLVSTNIRYLPDSICMLKHLKSLQLKSCNDLEELPKDLGQLVCLEKLKLSCKVINHLPDSICRMKNLKSLKLKNCYDLEELPRDLGQLVCLEKLKLIYTGINHLPDSVCMIKKLKFLKLMNYDGLEELPRDLGQLVCLEKLKLSCAGINHLPNSICRMKNLKSLKLKERECLEELPRDLGNLVCLEKLKLSCVGINHLPDSICMMKNLKSLKFEYCYGLEELPRDLGQLECLEKLILKKCRSLKYIPNNICKMKRLEFFHLPLCEKVENLPEELGRLECLKELDITDTRISHLPQSISLLEGLRVFGSEAVLRSCVFATEIQTSKSKPFNPSTTFCYIKAVDSTEAETRLENQLNEKNSNRWRWSVVVVVVGLLVRQVIHRPRTTRL